MEANNSGTNILVIGVGGGGNNAVNRMIEAGIASAEFVAINTDAPVLKLSKVKPEYNLQIGVKLTKGKGSGGKPQVGEEAARESIDDIRKLLENVDLLFVTAGMGGGTGTGAAPIVAEEARKLGILTIGIVTKPFEFEGPVRMENALNGISKISKFVDTLIVIPNDKLIKMSTRSDSIVQSFKLADNVLRIGIQGISDLIVNTSIINLDFADVKSVIENSGKAHMGLGEGEGENAMLIAVQQAVTSPLLETSISGAKGVIMNIVGGAPSLLDVEKACKHVKNVSDPRVNFIFGVGVDESMAGKIRVTIIATGFADKNTIVRPTGSGQPIGVTNGGSTHVTPPVRNIINNVDDKPKQNPTDNVGATGEFGSGSNGFGTGAPSGFGGGKNIGGGSFGSGVNTSSGFGGGSSTSKNGFSSGFEGGYPHQPSSEFSDKKNNDGYDRTPPARENPPRTSGNVSNEPPRKLSFLERLRKKKS